MRRFVGLLAVVGLLSQAGAKVIDQFDRPPSGHPIYGAGGQSVSDAVETVNAAPSYSTFDDKGAPTPGLLGGSRDMQLDASNAPSKGSFSNATANFAAGDTLSHSNNTKVSSVLRVQWDDMDTVDEFGGKGVKGTDWESMARVDATDTITFDDPKGTGLDTSIGLGDITDAGKSNVMQLAVTNDDSNNGDTAVEIRIYKKGGGATDYVTWTWTIVGTGLYSAPLAAFKSGGGAAPSFTDVGAVVMYSSSPADADMEYDFLRTVPEPATMAFLGLGVLPLLRRRRK